MKIILTLAALLALMGLESTTMTFAVAAAPQSPLRGVSTTSASAAAATMIKSELTPAGISASEDVQRRRLREDGGGGGGGGGGVPEPCGSAACAPTPPRPAPTVNPCVQIENNLNSCLVAQGYDGNRIGQCDGCVRRESSSYYGACETAGLCTDLEICYSNSNDRCHGCRNEVFALSSCIIDTVRADNGLSCPSSSGVCTTPPAPTPVMPVSAPVPTMAMPVPAPVPDIVAPTPTMTMPVPAPVPTTAANCDALRTTMQASCGASSRCETCIGQLVNFVYNGFGTPADCSASRASFCPIYSGCSMPLVCNSAEDPTCWADAFALAACETEDLCPGTDLMSCPGGVPTMPMPTMPVPAPVSMMPVPAPVPSPVTDVPAPTDPNAGGALVPELSGVTCPATAPSNMDSCGANNAQCYYELTVAVNGVAGEDDLYRCDCPDGDAPPFWSCQIVGALPGPSPSDTVPVSPETVPFLEFPINLQNMCPDSILFPQIETETCPGSNVQCNYRRIDVANAAQQSLRCNCPGSGGLWICPNGITTAPIEPTNPGLPLANRPTVTGMTNPAGCPTFSPFETDACSIDPSVMCTYQLVVDANGDTTPDWYICTCPGGFYNCEVTLAPAPMP